MRVKAGFMATLLLSACCSAHAQSGLTPPQIGFFRDGASSLRPLLGISGNFWLGEPVAAGSLSAASSGKASMFKTAESLAVLDALGHPLGRAWSARGTALFAFTPNGAPALAWLPESGELLRWNGIRFEPSRINPAWLNGTVVSMAAPDSSRAAFVIQKGSDLWRMDMSLFDGAVLFAAALPGTSTPALLLDDGSLLYAGKSSLVLRNPQGVDRITAFPGTAARFSSLGRDWILVESDLPPIQFGLRISNGALFELPEAPR